MDYKDFEGDACVWQIMLSNPFKDEEYVWKSHVIARTIDEALAVANSLADDDEFMVTGVILVGAYGIRTAPNVEFRKPKE